MKKLIVLLSILQLSTHAFTWKVGASQTYTTPGAIVNLVQDNDTIKFDAGVYLNDPVTWTKKKLVFIGLGTGSNRSIMKWNAGDIPNGKGLWVFANPVSTGSITIDNIVFDGARVSDANGGNGAGIRYQAMNLNIRDCLFTSCQNGILEGGSYNGSVVSITNTEFNNNGYEVTGAPNSGYEHSIYISSQTDSLLVQNCFFHDPRGEANSIKTRAQKSYILYNLIDEANGKGSWEINIAQGGLNIIIGNIIIQGTNSINHGIVSYDAATNSIENFYFIHNTVINKYPGNFTYFNVTPTSGINIYKIYNNIFSKVAGSNLIAFISGNPGAALDTMANRILPDYTTAGFVNSSANNFHLSAGATSLINNAVNAGLASNSFSLHPTLEYVANTSPLVQRIMNGPTNDIGAYEYANPNDIEANHSLSNTLIKCYPNPASNSIIIELPVDSRFANVEFIIFDITGKELKKVWLSNYTTLINFKGEIQSGLYFYSVYTGGIKNAGGKILIE